MSSETQQHDFVKKFNEKILKAGPVRIVDKKVQASLKPGQEPPKGSYIDYPPMNANINFSMLVPSMKLSASAVTTAETTLPENYTVTTIPGITPVGNQRQCGSCWAWSTAQAVNDVFVVQDYNKKLKAGEKNPVGTNPDISVMYMLSCYPNCRSGSGCNDSGEFPDSRMCGGGNPATLCNWISKYGVTWNPCVNYDACDNNAVCNPEKGDSQTHFSGDATSYLNRAFPTCGCYISNSNHQLYKINSVKRNSINIPLPRYFNSVDNYLQNLKYTINPSDHKNLVLNVKQHIKNYGTAVAGFFVLKNLFLQKGSSFYSCLGNSDNCGIFCKNPSGIYFDMVDYSNNSRLDKLPAFAGGHAVCVTGWGVGKVHKSLIDSELLKDTNLNIKVDPNTDCVNVPYWEVRNSWGKEWNPKYGGFFNIAMWPFNKVSALEINILGLGGIITFRPNPIPVTPLTSIKSNDKKGYSEDKKDYFTGNKSKPIPPPQNPSICDIYPDKIKEAKTVSDSLFVSYNNALKYLNNLISSQKRDCSFITRTTESTPKKEFPITTVIVALVIIIVFYSFYRFLKK